MIISEKEARYARQMAVAAILSQSPNQRLNKLGEILGEEVARCYFEEFQTQPSDLLFEEMNHQIELLAELSQPKEHEPKEEPRIFVPQLVVVKN